MANDEKNQLMLTQLVLMFETAALQHMGKLKNPFTDRIERDLQQARISIDMLEMLHAKMKNNLTAEEERMFSGALRDLRLNYVEEAAKPATEPAQPPPAAPAGEPTGKT